MKLHAMLIFAFVSIPILAQAADPNIPSAKPAQFDYFRSETKADKDARMAWWRNARFGMFIHWGAYSAAAGKYNGKDTYSEYVMNEAQIPAAEYMKLAAGLKPADFNVARVVSLAKEAGMKYLVITSKHHDGFCLWDSKYTDFDLSGSTGYKQDLLRQFSDECRKQGVTFCLYYSVMDWAHPDYLPRRGWDKRPTDTADFQKYVDYLKNQVSELISNYGPLGVIWFDGEWEKTWTAQYGNDLYNYIRNLQPCVIINNRVSKGRKGMKGVYDPNIFAGDFGTPEQLIPATGLSYDWETCMTISENWGYVERDKKIKSYTDLIRKLIDTASKGGNFLLDIGPKPDGSVRQEDIDRLTAIGRWMQTNSDSIYGTSASIFPALKFGKSTTKENTIYLHIFDWPADSKLRIPALISLPKSVYVLSERDKKLEITSSAGEFIITLPRVAPDPAVTVIALEFDSPAVLVPES
jgi:alpha-L-fucosidase